MGTGVDSLLYEDSSYLEAVGHPHGFANAVRYRGPNLAQDGFEERVVIGPSFLLTIKRTNLGQWRHFRYVRPDRLIFQFQLEGQRRVAIAGEGELTIEAPALIAYLEPESVSQTLAWPEGGSYTSVALSFDLDCPPQTLAPAFPSVCARFERVIAEKRHFWFAQPISAEMQSAARELMSPRVHASLLHSYVTLKAQELACLAVDSVLVTPRSDHRGVAAGDKASAAKAYIDARGAEGITVAALCRRLCVSQSHLSKTFRETFGVTVLAYITRARLAKAHDLLTFSDLHLKQIAYEAGYRHLSNFCIAFKKRYGVTPSACRAGSRQGDAVSG